MEGMKRVEPMDVWTPVGEYVAVTTNTMKNGRGYDKEHVKKFLKIGELYTVQRVEVGQSSSQVWLEEVKGTSFNTVMFLNVGGSH